MVLRLAAVVRLIGFAFGASARTERYADEGELLLGLTQHGAVVLEGGDHVPVPQRGGEVTTR